MLLLNRASASKMHPVLMSALWIAFIRRRRNQILKRLRCCISILMSASTVAPASLPVPSQLFLRNPLFPANGSSILRSTPTSSNKEVAQQQRSDLLCPLHDEDA